MYAHSFTDGPLHGYRQSVYSKYSDDHYTAALLGEYVGSVPYGSRVQVSYAGRSVVVEVDDSGGGKKGDDRVLDLSRAAMAYLRGHPVNDHTGGLIPNLTIRPVSRTTPLGPVK